MSIAARYIVCERGVSEAGGEFVQFKVTDPKEIDFNNNPSGKYGHPFGNKFFCDEHLGLALKCKHLT